MRITKSQLQDLINEEVASVLLKKQNRRLLESSTSSVLYEVDAQDLLNFASDYVSLGTAVQEQLHDLLDNQEDAEINPNALSLIETKLGGTNQEIDYAIQAWKDANLGEEEI